MRFWIVWASVNGLLSVIMSAWAAHGGVAAGSREYGLIEKASFYQLVHAVALLAIGGLFGRARVSNIIAVFFAAGQFFFCGSLYIVAITDGSLGYLTPFGGVCFMLGWLACAVAGGSVGIPPPKGIALSRLCGSLKSGKWMRCRRQS